MAPVNSTATPQVVQPVLEWGVATVALPGQEESGDLHLVELSPAGALVAVVDGLGHGAEAAVAAKQAVDALKDHAEEPVIILLQRCHEKLKKTRGAVMSLARLNASYNTLTWLGIGNVEGTLLRADTQATPPRETVMLHGGVLGFQMPILRATVTTIAPGDTLVFVTDGIASGYVHDLSLEGQPQRIADRISAKYSKGTDDALVLVARYLGGGS